ILPRELKQSTKHVELVVEDLRTRVRFPPAPPSNVKGSPEGVGPLRLSVQPLDLHPRPARTVSAGFRGACAAPRERRARTRARLRASGPDPARACKRERALQGQFPPAPPIPRAWIVSRPFFFARIPAWSGVPGDCPAGAVPFGCAESARFPASPVSFLRLPCR